MEAFLFYLQRSDSGIMKLCHVAIGQGISSFIIDFKICIEFKHLQ